MSHNNMLQNTANHHGKFLHTNLSECASDDDLQRIDNINSSPNLWLMGG